MKEKCQCGKPLKMRINGSPCLPLDTYDKLTKPDGLHFKTADRYCERCGVALCGECQVQLYNISDGIHTERVSAYTASIETVCHTCAELEME